jgi:predicted  nucleic acid-binding Zn-ribbon protein
LKNHGLREKNTNSIFPLFFWRNIKDKNKRYKYIDATSTSTNPEITQIKELVQHLYSLIKELKSQLNQKIDGIYDELDNLNGRCDNIEGEIEGL